MKKEIFITGAGVSAESGIPTFRGHDGFWTIGSENYTPQQMATRGMFRTKPDEFLLWYFKRFATYRNLSPNPVHKWLADKPLITQNIDTLDFNIPISKQIMFITVSINLSSDPDGTKL